LSPPLSVLVHCNRLLGGASRTRQSQGSQGWRTAQPKILKKSAPTNTPWLSAILTETSSAFSTPEGAEERGAFQRAMAFRANERCTGADGGKPTPISVERLLELVAIEGMSPSFMPKAPLQSLSSNRVTSGFCPIASRIRERASMAAVLTLQWTLPVEGKRPHPSSLRHLSKPADEHWHHRTSDRGSVGGAAC
jgi:hypothetical protein